MRVHKFATKNAEGWQKARDAKYPKGSIYDTFKRLRV